MASFMVGNCELADKYGIPRETLRRKFQLYKDREEACKEALEFETIFTAEQEQYLVDEILLNEARLYGFTSYEVRKMVLDYAKQLNLKHNFNHELEIVQRFHKEMVKVGIKKSQPASSAQANGFNKKDVLEFPILLSMIYGEHQFEEYNIYNVDGTGISFIPK